MFFSGLSDTQLILNDNKQIKLYYSPLNLKFCIFSFFPEKSITPVLRNL